MLLIEQAALFQGFGLDASPFLQDGRNPAEVCVGWRDVADAPMASKVILMVDEGADGLFQCARQVVVLEQYAALQRLMTALDLALGLEVVRRDPNMIRAVIAEPIGEIAGETGRAIVAEQSRLVNDGRRMAARGDHPNNRSDKLLPWKLKSASS